MKTGEGDPDYIVIDGPEKELLEVLSLSIHGLPSTVVSDSVIEVTDNCPGDPDEGSCHNSNFEFQPTTESVVENIEDKKPKKNANGAWKDWSPAALESKKPPTANSKEKKRLTVETKKLRICES
ncbi:hypothetical protein JTB14_026113 [Gonioctena quinquepunctata]|nr:hypothetical protein JTB14_026113 [Gonioctena quinquepunctata]